MAQVRQPGEAGAIIALDQGTSNTKVLVVDAATGQVLRRASRAVNVSFPGPAQVEQDGDQIWSLTMAAAAEALAGIDPATLIGVTIANQRESVALWDAATGHLQGPVLGWQDARTAEACAALGAHAGTIRARTGLDLDPMFSAPKANWLLTHRGGPSSRVGTIDTFLVHRLTGEFLAEAGNASRTLLLDLDRVDWDDELTRLFEIPGAALAPVVPSTGDFGRTLPGLAIPAGLPVLAVLADSHAALYFHSQGRAGEGKATYGTGSSIMVATAATAATAATTAPAGIATTLAWQATAAVYAREGNIVASGAALALMAEILTGGDLDALGALAAEASPGHGHSGAHPQFVPAFSGLGAPYFDRGATGIITGITGSTTRAGLARAAFDAVAYQVTDVVDAMESDGRVRLDVLHADGGATASDLLMGLQASLLGREVRVGSVAEASALGAARMGAERLGALNPGDPWGTGPARIVRPTPAEPGRGGADRAAWARAVQRSRGHRVETVTETTATETTARRSL